jgi:hypothetical protein
MPEAGYEKGLEFVEVFEILVLFKVTPSPPGKQILY